MLGLADSLISGTEGNNRTQDGGCRRKLRSKQKCAPRHRPVVIATVTGDPRGLETTEPDSPRTGDPRTGKVTVHIPEKGPGTDMAAPGSRVRRTHTAAESDKDSGYSDVASECLSSAEPPDADDGPPTSRWAPGESSGGPQSGHTSLLLLRNVLIGQDSGSDPEVQSWAVRPSLQLFPSSSQLLVFPPPVTAGRPQAAGSTPTKYLPILNSYPRIAPHPSPQPDAPSQPCTNKRKAGTAPHPQPKRPTTASSCAKEPCAGGTAGPERADAAPSHDPAQQNRSRRFHNTLDVLHRSGLFSIAMKTKELTRLNQATQLQLERLHQQVALLTQAASSNHPQDWQRLQDALET